MNEKILFVDDDISILSACKRLLSSQYDVITVDSGKQGIIELKEKGPIAVVVSDFRMPEMNGVQFLSSARQISPDTVRILLTGQADIQATIGAVNEGNIFRFLTKPCENPKLIKALNSAIEQYQLVIAERELLDRTLKGSVKLLSDILSMVSPIAFSCSSRISSMVKRLAVKLNMENIWEVELAAMLSQIGCVTIPGETLEKRNRGEILSENEKVMFKEYPQIGKNLLANIPRLEGIAQAVAYQDKQFDGGGTPVDNKKGTDIPLIARILKVVLDLDVMLTKGITKLQALKEMRTRSQWYDSEVFAALETEIINIKEGYVLRKIMLKDIQPGMILADDIKTSKGVLLIQKGHEITNVIRTRLLNINNVDSIVEPIMIIKDL
ncbi:MAG: response regulator [Candidatus Scalindua sp.]|nr:response regulator [Candidatus Scalindua sp.]